VAPHDGRRLQHVVLDAPGVGRIGLAISLPDPLPKRPLSIVMVVGGLATGERNIRHIPGGGDNAIVGYDWPIPTRRPLSQAAGLFVSPATLTFGPAFIGRVPVGNRS
jgi:hypothetical protein